MIKTGENRKSSGDFSFVKTLGGLVVNDRFSRGYREMIEKTNADNENTFIWRSLSAIGDDIGNILYENVRHYIANVSDVDTCTVKSLASLAKELGVANVSLMDNLIAVPTDVLKLVDLFSINPSLLLDEDFINAPLVQELTLCCVTAKVSEMTDAVSPTINAENPPENNPELSDMSITYNINADKFYNEYLPAKFYDYLTSVISAEFMTTPAISARDNPDKAGEYEKHYVLEAFDTVLSSTLEGVLKDRNYGYEYLDPQCADEISTYIQLNNLSPYFNPSEILDNVDNGTDRLENYTDTERTLLSAVRESRETAMFTLSGDPALFLTTRYDYYKARKILDLFVFINNLLGRGAKVRTSEWLPDTRYSKLSIEYANDGVVRFKENQPPEIVPEVIDDAAKTLADVCRSIQTIRERVKTFTQQVYLRGSTLLMQFVVNEYLRYTLPYKYANLVDSGLIDAIPKLDSGWPAGDNYDRVSVIEYWDTTEYYNLSTEHSDYARNYGYVNYPFWLRPNDSVDSNSIPRSTINDFYMKMLGMNTVLSSKGNDTVSGFLSTIYSMGLLDAYIDNDVSVQVLPVEQTPASALNTSNPGVLSALRDYQAFLAKTYSGLSTGTEPYYNWKNVTHPSWQVHPYLWNFIEKSDLDNVIETTYNITANGLRLAAMKTDRVSACIGDASEILNLWRFKTEDFSGYLTRYELGRQSFLKWNMQPSPVVNYDGIFYPDAIDDYINALSSSETRTYWYNEEEDKYKIEIDEEEEESGEWIQVTVKAKMFDLLSSMRTETDFNRVSAGYWPETFYGAWYSHLQGGFETSAFMNQVADQLSVYGPELCAIYAPRVHRDINWFEYHPLTPAADASVFIPLVDDRPVDVYRYALDKYMNSYILIKRCHPETPEHIKKIIPGQLWIRFANHPIAFPAFGLPDDYLSCYEGLSGVIGKRESAGIRRDVPQVSPFKSNNCIVDYLSAEVHENPNTCWDFVYDFDITKDGNTVVIVADSKHPNPGNGDSERQTVQLEEDLLESWQSAVLLVGEPYRSFETVPPRYTLAGDWEAPLNTPDNIGVAGWKFAGLNEVDSDNESAIHALYLRYEDETISIAESVIPSTPDFTEVSKAKLYDYVDEDIEIPDGWRFDWTVAMNSCGDINKYMVVGKVPFFTNDLKADETQLNTQNWYGRSNAEIYLREKDGLSAYAALSVAMKEKYDEEGDGAGHMFPTLDALNAALADLVKQSEISANRIETMADMPGLVNYAGIQLSTDTEPVTEKKRVEWGHTWNSAERFGTSILRLFFYNSTTVPTQGDQYIINSDASYIPLYPGTDGATRTWPVDNEILKDNVGKKVADIMSGDDESVAPAYRLYWQTLSEEDREAEKAAMVEDAMVNSKQPIAAQNLGPEYDGLGDKIDAMEQSLSTNTNSEGEEVLVGSTAFTGSDAVHRVIEEYDESKYYNVWLKPEASKFSETDNPLKFDIDIPLYYLSVINGDDSQTSAQILGLSAWNFLIYNIDSPNVPIVAEPVLSTLERKAADEDLTKVHYVNIPTTYQKYFLEHHRVKDDLMGIDGNRDLFAVGMDRDSTTTNYFMGVDGLTMDCNVATSAALGVDIPVSDWKVTLHFTRDPAYIDGHFVVDKNQIVAFLYSKDFSQFEDYHYLQHHDVWPHATQLISAGYKTVNERVPISSELSDSAYMTYLSAGNRYGADKDGVWHDPFTSNLYPISCTEGYHLSGISSYNEFPGSILSGTHAFKINEESRSDRPNMYPDFLFYQSMASAFNLVVTETQDGNIFDLSNTYIMEIVDPWRMVEAMGEFDVLTYGTHNDNVFMRAYEEDLDDVVKGLSSKFIDEGRTLEDCIAYCVERGYDKNYMRDQFSISKYDRDVVPYVKWYNALEPYPLSDHLCAYSDLSIAWSSERKLDLSAVQLVNIAESRDKSGFGPENRNGCSYGGLFSSELDAAPSASDAQDLSSVAEIVGHGVSADDGNVHTFAPAGVMFANTVGKRWVTADWNDIKNRCKLFINYENIDGKFVLYFNYNNFFYNEYLYLTKEHTFRSCYKRTTYLTLNPGEAGTLEIIAQPKVYDAAGDVCGIRDVRLFTFMVKNTSDDKPKFDIIKTYELAKGGLPMLDYPSDVAPPGGVYVHTVERESEIELVRQGAFDFVTSEDLNVSVPGEIIDNYGLRSISCDFLFEGFNPYLECDFDNCVGGMFESGGVGRIHFETTSRSSFSLAFKILAGQYISENELSFEIPIEIESAKGTGSHGEIVDLKKIPGGANIMFIGSSTENRALAKEPAGYDVTVRNNRDHGGFVLAETGGTGIAKGKPIAIFTPVK